ncbi:MAG: ATP-dependent DNA helicase RecG [Prevotella sp.]|nr:ATP-dependent DNA helicase RecG [Prevotella sp.]MBR6187470.1 ATP-dependent DNA helicase RecG [Prevotella sp.]
MDILSQDIMYLTGVGPNRKKLLSSELEIETFGDLLEYYPYKYVDRSKIYKVSELTGEMPFVQVVGHILSFETFDMGPRKERVVGHFSDGTGIMDLVWFNGGRYAKEHYRIGQDYLVFGRPSVFNNRIQVQHPEIEEKSEMINDKYDNLQAPESNHISNLPSVISHLTMRPYYNTTEKMKKYSLTSRGVEKLVRNLLEKLKEPLPETIPDFITSRLHLMNRDKALRTIHYPQDAKELERARVRLKFEELFYVQLNILRYASDQRRKYRGFVFNRIGEVFNTFYYDHLPFNLTGAQKRVMHEIRRDMASGRQMNRLLQGDVGSGKTLVALMAMLIAIDNGFQACMMAPTEILAEQHLATIAELLQGMDVRVELLTGMVKGKKRQEILDGLLDGNVQILVGTHAIIEDTVQFCQLGMVIIDEQHRFGVAQRAKLWGKSFTPPSLPHVLVMTATPIPRTLAMTLYGDLDVSVIDELPPGRKPIQTTHVFESRMASLYDGIRRQINQGRQVYIVYPLIEESEKMDLKNLEQGFEMLRQVFPEFHLSKVHGRMKPKDKEEEMQRFVRGETQILVATTVIEVGVNVPNASVMVIIDAQRFGLSQLHQLRGRVGRGADQSFCILVTNYKLSEVTRKRIDIMCETNDGFRIAEADLKLRGPGDLEGTQQSGMAFDLKIADIARDGQLVQMARDEAQRIVDEDPTCTSQKYEILWSRLKQLHKTNINWSAIS